MNMNQVDLKGRIAVITGGARGIGYAIAERVLRSGGSVSLWDLDAARLEQARTSLVAVDRVLTVTTELTSDERVRSALSAALERFGRIDILINNADITGGNAPVWELDPAVWRQVIEVNLTAPFLTCRAVVPHMLSQNYGRIVNPGVCGNVPASEDAMTIRRGVRI